MNNIDLINEEIKTLENKNIYLANKINEDTSNFLNNYFDKDLPYNHKITLVRDYFSFDIFFEKYFSLNFTFTNKGDLEHQIKQLKTPTFSELQESHILFKKIEKGINNLINSEEKIIKHINEYRNSKNKLSEIRNKLTEKQSFKESLEREELFIKFKGIITPFKGNFDRLFDNLSENSLKLYYEDNFISYLVFKKVNEQIYFKKEYLKTTSKGFSISGMQITKEEALKKISKAFFFKNKLVDNISDFEGLEDNFDLKLSSNGFLLEEKEFFRYLRRFFVKDKVAIF